MRSFGHDLLELEGKPSDSLSSKLLTNLDALTLGVFAGACAANECFLEFTLADVSNAIE